MFAWRSPATGMRQPRNYGKYDASFKDTQYTFSAMVFETLGAVSDQGEEVLRQLFRFAAKRLTVAEPGLECACCNGLFRKLF